MLQLTNAVPWLPAQCLTSKRAAEPFERIISEWADTWFAENGWQVLGTWDAVGQPNTANWQPLRDGANLCIKGKPKALHELALAMLGAQEKPKYTAQDLQLMRRIARSALDDLQSAIEKRLGARSNAALVDSSPQFSLLIGVVGNAQLAIECNASDLVRLVRESFPGQNVEAGLSTVQDALMDEEIDISASLGSAVLCVEEFSRLEVGDILVLDQVASKPARLAIDDYPTDVPVSIHEAGGKVTLEVQEL